MRLRVKVTPKASADRILSWQQDVLRVKVTAAPEKGRANKAVEQLLAARLGLTGHKVKVISGFSAPRKTVEINAPEEDVNRILRRP